MKHDTLENVNHKVLELCLANGEYRTTSKAWYLKGVDIHKVKHDLEEFYEMKFPDDAQLDWDSVSDIVSDLEAVWLGHGE